MWKKPPPKGIAGDFQNLSQKRSYFRPDNPNINNKRPKKT